MLPRSSISWARSNPAWGWSSLWSAFYSPFSLYVRNSSLPHYGHFEVSTYFYYFGYPPLRWIGLVGGVPYSTRSDDSRTPPTKWPSALNRRLFLAAVKANPETLLRCDKLDPKTVCSYEDLQRICQYSEKKCKRHKVSFYNDPSLEITSNTNRESSDYNYNHIYG